MISNRETHDFRYRIIRNRASVYIHHVRAQYFPECAEFYSKIGTGGVRRNRRVYFRDRMVDHRRRDIDNADAGFLSTHLFDCVG